MKTFKLVSLEVVEDYQRNIETDELPLLDGLIINREDDKNQWLIEAYIESGNWDYFQKLKDSSNNVMLYAKISKATNKPAPFLSKIVSLNKVEENMNILFLGTLVDEKKEKVEHILKSLIDEGYQGEELLKKFMNEV